MSDADARGALRRKQATELAFVEAKLKRLAAPSLGKKALTGPALAAQRSQQLAEASARHAAEIEDLERRLAAAALDAPAAQLAAPADAVGAAAAASAASAPASSPASAPATSAATASPEAGGDADDGEDAADAGADPGARKKGKAQRRKDRKAAEFQALRGGTAGAAAAAAAAEGPSARDLENAELRKQLTPLGLDIKPIAADGHCMFRAAADQLAVRTGYTNAGAAEAAAAAAAAAAAPDFLVLRTRAAEYIRVHWQEFAPFLPYEERDGFPSDVWEDGSTGGGGGGGEAAATRAAVDRYCERLVKSSCWGGHPELRALACTVGVPLVVFQAGQPPTVFRPSGAESGRGSTGLPGGVGPDEFALRLSFHRQYLTLGEHYNSVVAASGRQR